MLYIFIFVIGWLLFGALGHMLLQYTLKENVTLFGLVLSSFIGPLLLVVGTIIFLDENEVSKKVLNSVIFNFKKKE